jgi:hypothetical protein
VFLPQQPTNGHTGLRGDPCLERGEINNRGLLQKTAGGRLDTIPRWVHLRPILERDLLGTKLPGCRTDPGEQVLFHPFEPAFPALLAPPAGLGGVQLASDFFEGVGFRKLEFKPFDLPAFGQVRARLLGAAGEIPLAAGLLQGNRWVGAEREALFLAGEVVLPEPALGSAG